MNKARVLIVDDELDIVESIKFNLELENIECLVAYDGEEALTKAKEEHPDLIILDVILPKINGYNISSLLKFDESYKNIPIIMLTARTKEIEIKIGDIAGADEYVTKPFNMQRLVVLVKKYLNRNS